MEPHETYVHNVHDTRDNHESQISAHNIFYEENISRDILGNVGQSSDNTESAEKIKEKICTVLKELINSEELEEFSNILSEKIANNLKNLDKQCDQSKDKSGTWLESERNHICQPCFKFSKSESVPQSLRKYNGKDLGMISKQQDQKHINSSKKSHELNELHIWCCLQYEKSLFQTIEMKEKSDIAGKMIVRNAIFCLTKGFSAQDFVDLNVKDSLNMDLKEKVATKNDSKAQFFFLRDIIYDKVSSKLKSLMQSLFSQKKLWITVTLDKVTVNRKSYTVVATYFFYEGAIYCFLNQLAPLSTKDYDGKGTARMLIDCLTDSLGLSRLQLAEVLIHFVVDGVYVTPDLRPYGGGSLSLKVHVADQLGLPENSITLDQDGAHNLQLIFDDTIEDNKLVGKIISTIFNVMKDYNAGKAATEFDENASRLGTIVLSNKNYQATRFASSTLRGIKSSMRNLPTAYKIKADKYTAFVQEEKNTKAKEVNKQLVEMRSTHNIALMVGFVQILEIFTEASLACQQSKYFPTQVWNKINSVKATLQSWADEWEWSDQDLKMSGIGKPTAHVTNLENGIYRPYIAPKVISRNKTHDCEIENETSTDDENEEEDDEEELDQPFQNEIGLEGVFSVEQPKVKAQLSGICASLLENWQIRQTETPLQKATIEAFGKSHDVSELSDADAFNCLHEKLERVIHALPEHQKVHFDSLQAMPGFENWNSFLAQNPKTPMHLLWKQFVALKEVSGQGNFMKLFECTQIRSMSEAICESIGSMMGTHTGRNRYLKPDYFSKELFLRYNLGGLHSLEPLIEEIVQDTKTEYVRRCNSKRPDMLVSVTSSTIYNYKQKESKKSRLPLDLWK